MNERCRLWLRNVAAAVTFGLVRPSWPDVELHAKRARELRRAVEHARRPTGNPVEDMTTGVWVPRRGNRTEQGR